VSFDVSAGETIGIIGRNGSGKSTLLKSLARITALTEGTIRLRGRVGSLLEVGTGFHPELTGRENVYLNGAILGMKRQEIAERFDAIAGFSGVERFLDTPVKRYSSGMYVRLAFAVAAHLDPDILLVDEVLSVGDAEFQRKCLQRMSSFAESGRTVVFVSHNMWAVRRLCDRVIILDRGSILAEGNTDEIVHKYLQGAAEAVEAEEIKFAMGPIESYRVVGVRLLDDDGAAVRQFAISRGATAEIEYEVLRPGTRVGFSLVLFDDENRCLFGSLNNTDAEHGAPRDAGAYVAACEIPGDLLNAGTYSLSVICTESGWTNGHRLNGVLTFTAVDDGVLRGDYSGGYSGSLRPRLRWTTRRADGE